MRRMTRAVTIALCVSALAALAARLFLMPTAFAQSNTVATPAHAATVTIAAPRNAADVFLDIYLKSYRPPPSGSVEAVVSLGEVEVGRISIFPAEAFTVTGPHDQRAYRFDAKAALDKLKGAASLTVSVRLVDETGATAKGGEFVIDKALFSPRP